MPKQLASRVKRKVKEREREGKNRLQIQNVDANDTRIVESRNNAQTN